MFNKSRIMKRAHEIARELVASEEKGPSWATRHSYEEHMSYALRAAWQETKERSVVRRRRDEILAIQCGSKRLSVTDRARINELQAEISALAA